jgi:hypothetical protein
MAGAFSFLEVDVGNQGGVLILVILVAAALMCGALPVMGAVTAVAEGDNGGLLIIPFIGVCLLLLALLVMRILPEADPHEMIRREELKEARHQAALREYDEQ